MPTAPVKRDPGGSTFEVIPTGLAGKVQKMNRKILLLALGAVSAMMLAVPTMASAINALHLNPTPQGAQTIDSNGAATLSTTGGTSISCNGFTGSATFEAGGTTGSMQLTFGPNCTTNLGGTCTNEGLANSIKTKVLPFHLATVLHAHDKAKVGAGVLVTPANGVFAEFTCHNVAGFLTVASTVTGNGVIGTITAPACNAKSKTATILFETTSNGVQTHTTLAGTESTSYGLKKGEEGAAQAAHGTLTLSSESELVCT